MRKIWSSNILGRAIDEAFQEVNELRDEMEAAFAGTPDVFRDSTGRAREKAAEDLDAASTTPFVPESVANLDVKWIEMVGKGVYRPQRRDNVVRCLQSCVARLLTSTNDDISELKKELQVAIDILIPLSYQTDLAM